ncbi:MAG: folate-binding protein YgfZ [Aggregatilineales bacterium]
MTDLHTLYTTNGATLAQDGIPLHFGDIKAEYHAALNDALLLDRSHEGRIEITGRDRFEILNRISTNNILNIPQGEARPTLLINANGRILERLIAFNWKDESLLILTGPGRGKLVFDYLSRQIFFNDQAQVRDLSAETYQFTLHGPKSSAVFADLLDTPLSQNPFQGEHITVADKSVYTSLLKPFSEQHRLLICSREDAPIVWETLIQAGQKHGLRSGGGLTYNTLRIRAGFPGIGRELSTDYIPLEVGLWDEVSFNKGCYTGQEIIARMESRERIAKTIVHLTLDRAVNAPIELFSEGKKAGTLTSSVTTPDGEHLGIGILKTGVVQTGHTLTVGEETNAQATIGNLIGTQPAWILEHVKG